MLFQSGLCAKNCGKGVAWKTDNTEVFSQGPDTPFVLLNLSKSNKTANEGQKKTRTKSNNDGLRSQGHVSLAKAPLDKMLREGSSWRYMPN